MGKRLVITVLFLISFIPFSALAQKAAEPSKAPAVEACKCGSVPETLLLDERFQKILELSVQPKEHVIKNAKEKFHKKQDHPVLKEKMVARVQNLCHCLRMEALQTAKDMGLQLNPQQQNEFILDYWQKRVEVEKTLRQEVQPRRADLTEKANQELKAKFSKPAPSQAKP